MGKERIGLISREDLGIFSEEFLEVLEREGIDSHGELEKRLGDSFGTVKGFIQLEARPGGRSISPSEIVHTISYIIEGLGIPIEVRMSPKSGYSTIIVKSVDYIEDYRPVFHDGFGNCIQESRFEFSFDEVKNKLKNLTN